MQACHTQASSRVRAITSKALVNNTSSEVVNIASTEMMNEFDKLFPHLREQ